ncbi:3-oxoacid CoA-transferase subunit B [Rhodobacteraceae bacterium RKSG542]|uniref:3-oxoacid CoA-transferase subunit B n=1 Tax=Pseudovibrio flavus TaxID=2529854 RepID=UPI0012BC235B|nr:3-oxoacid CoA-transferase subunit B [Pseudovibrio flavus]MTI17743.1 3-oxoacid CoA-transferase subunit B [Pseudovibrio flavus]
MNSKEFIAARVAKEFKDGDTVNLGAGLPNLAVKYLTPGTKIYLQAENGIVGFGPHDPEQPINPFCTDAGENPITINKGGAIVDSVTSFGLIRGGHLKLSVLGAMQVDEEGSIANWLVPGGKMAGMGGAMDLVCGAKKVIATMEHNAKDGSAKILKKCTYPLTGERVLSAIVTELGFFEVTPEGLVLREISPNVTVDEIRARTEASFTVDENLKEMTVN